MLDHGGVDAYSNAISDIYQDNFDEGIFTGKGIYDVAIFYDVLKNEIPENTVLSHDLLEGSYLRCGLATDILVLDEFPVKYNSYITRLTRWIRGDWQIYAWARKKLMLNGNKKNPLNRLSRFKIIDNLKRSFMPISTIRLIIFNMWLYFFYKINLWEISFISIIAYLFPSILDIVNSVVFKKSINSNYILAHKNMVKTIGTIKGTYLRAILNFAFLPYLAYVTCLSIIKTLYRIKILKKHLLEWTTSEDAEKLLNNSLHSYIKTMYFSIIIGTLTMVFGIIFKKVFSVIFGMLWLIAPLIAYWISRENLENTRNELSKDNEEYLLEVGKKTWQYFKDNINEKNNFLPPDNYQEDRKEKIARKDITY